MRLSTSCISRIGVTVATLSLASSAAAEEGQGKHRFGNPGFVLSADRLLPLLSYQSVKTTDDGASDTQSRLSIALMNNAPFAAYSSFYNLPRLAFDWIPIQNLTVGGAIWVYADLKATDTMAPASGPSTTTNTPKYTYWGVAPRVGYVVPIGEMVSFWPRAGVEYLKVSSSNVGSGSGSIEQFALDVEAMLIISPWNHFGFTVGPNIDIPISGEQTTTSNPTANGTSTSTRVHSAMFQLGLSAGMLGHF